MARLQALVGLPTVGGKLHRHAALAQGSAQPQGDVGRVFHQQDARTEGIHGSVLTGV
jgi:hypothetical protein